MVLSVLYLGSAAASLTQYQRDYADASVAAKRGEKRVGERGKDSARRMTSVGIRSTERRGSPKLETETIVATSFLISLQNCGRKAMECGMFF